MRRFFLPLILCFGLTINTLAQTPKDIMKEPIPVFMFQATYALQLPALETKTLYGLTNTIGGSVVYKTTSNWLLTANGNFIFGNKVKGDRISIFGEGITTVDGELIGGGGSIATLAIYQRGFHFQAEAGKLFPFGPNPNCGFFVQGGIGFLRNRIYVDYQQSVLNPPDMILDDYEYGYDRMRGGPALHLESGYLLLNNTRLLNLSISFEVTYARTRDFRDYDFRVFTNPETGVMEPVGRTDPNKRYNDLYYGIRIGWNIPTYQRQPETFYYN